MLAMVSSIHSIANLLSIYMSPLLSVEYEVVFLELVMI